MSLVAQVALHFHQALSSQQALQHQVDQGGLEDGDRTTACKQYCMHPNCDQDNDHMQTCSMSGTRAMSLQCQVNVHNYV